MPTIWDTLASANQAPVMEPMQSIGKPADVNRSPASPGKGGATRTLPLDKPPKNEMSYDSVAGIKYAFDTSLAEDDSYFKILNALETRQEQREKERRDTISKLQEYQQSVAKGTNEVLENSPLATLDLRPAAALVDAWTGSNLAQSVGKPLDIGERSKLIQGLQEKVEEQKDKAYQENSMMNQLKMNVGIQREDQRQKNEITMQTLGAKLFTSDMQTLTARLRANKGISTKPVPAGVREKFGKMEMAIADTRDLIDYAKANQLDFGVLQSVKAKIPGPWFEKEKQLASEILLRLTTIGRGIEGGVLRKEDERKFGQILAAIQDTPHLAMTKLRELEHALSQYYIIQANTYTGAEEQGVNYFKKVAEGLQKPDKNLGAKTATTPSGTTAPTESAPSTAAPSDARSRILNKL